MPEVHQPHLRVELEEMLLVGTGATAGALLRWQIGHTLHDRDLLVNLVGAAILGFLTGLPYAPRRNLLLGIGFCGSATTFSSLMLNAVEMLFSGGYSEAIGLIGLTFGLGIGSAALGYKIGTKF